MKNRGTCFLETGKKSLFVAAQDANPEIRILAFKLAISGFGPIEFVFPKWRGKSTTERVFWGEIWPPALMQDCFWCFLLWPWWILSKERNGRSVPADRKHTHGVRSCPCERFLVFPDYFSFIVEIFYCTSNGICWSMHVKHSLTDVRTMSVIEYLGL